MIQVAGKLKCNGVAELEQTMTIPQIVVPMSQPALCIPHARRDTNSDQVAMVFERLIGKGCILRVDERQLRDPRDQSFFKRYFVHFREWPESARDLRQKLLDGGTIKVVYSDPWFWKCSAARPRNTTDNWHHPSRVPRPKPSLPSPLPPAED